MAFPPIPAVPHGPILSAYFNAAFGDANTLIVAAQTSATTANTSIAAASATPVAGALVKYDAVTKAVTLQPGTLSRNVMKELGVWASAPHTTVVNYGGGTFIDKTGASPTPRVLTAGTTSHAAPTSGLERWDIVSMAPGTAGVTVKTGATAAIGTNPTSPPASLTITAATDVGLYAVYTKFGMTGIADVADGTNGFIVPLAALNFGGGGGGAGTGLLNTDVVWIWGGAGDDPSALDPYTMLNGTAGSGLVNGHNKENLRVALTRIATDDPATVANAPTLANLLGHFAGGLELRPQDYISFSGSTITIAPNVNAPFPATAMFPDGKMREIKTAIPHTVSPGGGDTIYAILLDGTPGLGGTPGVPNPGDGTMDFQLLSPPPLAITATQKLLGLTLNNGSGFLGLNYSAFDPLLQVSGAQVVPLWESVSVAPGAAYTTTSTVGGATPITQATKTIHLPRNMRVRARGYCRLSALAAVHLYGGLFVDGQLQGQLFDVGANSATNWDLAGILGGTTGTSSDTLLYTAGLHTVTVQIFGYTASANFTVQSVVWDLEAGGVFS